MYYCKKKTFYIKYILPKILQRLVYPKYYFYGKKTFSKIHKDVFWNDMTFHIPKRLSFQKDNDYFSKGYINTNQINYSHGMDMWAYNEKNSYSIFEKRALKKKEKRKRKEREKVKYSSLTKSILWVKRTEHSENPSYVHSYHSEGSIGSIVTFCYSLYSFFVKRSRPLWKRVCPFSVERRRPLCKRVLSFSVERRRPLWKRVCPFSVERRRPLRKRVLYYLSGDSDVIVESSSGLLGDWM